MWIVTRAGLILILLSTADARADLPAWLAGCWQNPDGSTKEVWVIESSQSLIGFSASAKANHVGFYELMRIHMQADGSWVFTAWPSGQAPTSFRSQAATPDSITFSNPDHDYPQVIQYRLRGDVLEATISLDDGDRRQDFTRTPCR